jgi:adenine-specific DNA-methyltransferase
MNRLMMAERLWPIGNTLSYVRYLDDYPVKPISNAWMDTGLSGFSSDKAYVVQTNPDVIERCLLGVQSQGVMV